MYGHNKESLQQTTVSVSLRTNYNRNVPNDTNDNNDNNKDGDDDDESHFLLGLLLTVV